MNISPDAILAIACREVFDPYHGRLRARRVERSEKKDFATYFGMSPEVAADVWNRIDPPMTVS